MIKIDNKEILENVKQKIAISNFESKEDIVMKKSNKSILKTASVACLVTASITGAVFAKDIGGFFKNLFGDGASDGVQIAVDNGYFKEVEPKYIDSDGIEFAVDSFLIDDYNLDINLKMKLSDKYDEKIMQGASLQDLKILDENGDIVFITYELQTQIAEENGTIRNRKF